VARHVVSAALLWVFLTALGEASIFLDWFPSVGASEAEDFDRIFLVLLAMGFPVFAFVVAVLVYSMLEFKTKDPGETGATFVGRGLAPRVWIAITSALALLVMIYPGMTGLAELSKESGEGGWGEHDAELVVQVTGFRWAWKFDYPESGISLLGAQEELVLPAETVVRFDINSEDVVHSFWIPAFRMKIDAIPGRTTFFTVETKEPGSYDTSTVFRAQCAELCGLDHSGMVTRVRVVTQEEFRDWVDSQTTAAARGQ